MNARPLNPEVMYALDEVRAWGEAELRELMDRAAESQSGVCRLCLHRDISDPVHEMLIAKCRDSVYPPHRHPVREESYQVLRGRARLLLFDDEGRVTDEVPLGEPGGGRACYVRLPKGRYHDLIIESDLFVFLETRPGPFCPEDNEFAPFEVK